MSSRKRRTPLEESSTQANNIPPKRAKRVRLSPNAQFEKDVTSLFAALGNHRLKPYGANEIRRESKSQEYFGTYSFEGLQER